MPVPKTIEQLENDFWPDPDSDSYVVQTCHQLRKKPLAEFEVEDLRILIGQNIGLTYLIPMALDVLNKNVLAEGHLYPGDLLKAVMTSDTTYWQQEPKNLIVLKELIEQNKDLLKSEDESLYQIGKAL